MYCRRQKRRLQTRRRRQGGRNEGHFPVQGLPKSRSPQKEIRRFDMADEMPTGPAAAGARSCLQIPHTHRCFGPPVSHAAARADRSCRPRNSSRADVDKEGGVFACEEGQFLMHRKLAAQFLRGGVTKFFGKMRVPKSPTRHHPHLLPAFIAIQRFVCATSDRAKKKSFFFVVVRRGSAQSARTVFCSWFASQDKISGAGNPAKI
jgi:hypothetical protein